MIRVFLIASVLTAALVGPSQADPIFTPLFTALLGATLANTVIVGTLTVGGLLSGIATALVTTAIGLLFQPKAPKPEDGRIPQKGTINPRIYGGGRVRISGAIVLDEVVKNYLFVILAMVGHKVSGFVQPYLNDEPLTVASGVWTTALPAPAGGTVDNIVQKAGDGAYPGNHVRLDYRLGLDTETHYDWVIQTLAFLSGEPASTTTSSLWTSSAKGHGVASTAMVCRSVKAKHFASHYPNPTMALTWVIDMAPMWDPRDGDQDPEDASTWSYAPTNFALNVLWFMCFSPYGRQLNYETALLPVLDDWIEQINICDELVPLKAGGTEKRYEIGWWATADNPTRVVQREMMKAADAWTVERPDGTVLLRVGKYIEPTIVLEDSDICGFEIQDDVKDGDSVNELMVAYTSPSHGYTTTEIGPWIDEDDQLTRGSRRGERLELPWVQSPGQASRLVKREGIRNRCKRGKLYLRLFSKNGINAALERWVKTGNIRIPVLANLSLELKEPRFMVLKQMIEVGFTVVGAEIDTYNPATDEFDPPPVPVKPASEELGKLTNVDAVPVEKTVGTTSTIFLTVSFDDPERDDLQYLIQWRIADTGSGQPGAWVDANVEDPPDAVTGRITLQGPVLPLGEEIDVVVIAIPSKGTRSPASDQETISTTPAGIAPSSPSLSVAGGTGSATATVVAPNSASAARVKLWRVVTGGGFGSSTLVATRESAPNQSHAITDTYTAGSYHYYATAENEYGTASTPTGPVAATIS